MIFEDIASFVKANLKLNLSNVVKTVSLIINSEQVGILEPHKDHIYKKKVPFKSIHDKIKIEIQKCDSNEILDILEVTLEEIIPGIKFSRFNNFPNTKISAKFEIKIPLYPLDAYILNYFCLSIFYYPDKLNDIVNTIANEIILYDPNHNQRQLDSLYFASAIIYLFRESSDISDTVLNLIPMGILEPLFFKKEIFQFKQLFLDEFRDTLIYINQKNEANILVEKMMKAFLQCTNNFITNLEEKLFEFILNDKLHSVGDIQDFLLSDYYSLIEFHVRLEDQHKKKETDDANYNGMVTTINALFRKFKKDEEKSDLFENVFLYVDLSPEWNIPMIDKKDQLLTSEKEGTLEFKSKFILFTEEKTNIKIRIPYKIIDSYFNEGGCSAKGLSNPNATKESTYPNSNQESHSFTIYADSDEVKQLLDQINTQPDFCSSDSYCIIIYDGAQLYTFKNLNKENGERCIKLLKQYTKKQPNDSFRETLRKKWKKDQMFVLQTESFKGLVSEPGTKVKIILDNLLCKDTYALSDIIILQNSCIRYEDVAIDTLDQIKSKWKLYLSKNKSEMQKLQLIKVTKKIFSEKVVVSSKKLFKELMDWIDSLQYTSYILVDWTKVGQKANKMVQKMKNYSIVNVHQIKPNDAGDYFNEELIKPYLTKYTQLPNE
ncbi:hypothetical protein M9Y10_009913 [Tritrichomonas musculus]|uniref:Uncharacterized protein n=1 Tax=Tritrichomonas musculus TaxID=1915356 RepID=A0ABR2IPV4_9EUKA